jgi:hypothetical protein
MGNACAVGCLIPDKEYRPQIEGLSIDAVFPAHGEWVPDELQNGVDSSREAIFAEVLNNSGIPATEAIFNRLSLWQKRHDTAGNWSESTYIGPTD